MSNIDEISMRSADYPRIAMAAKYLLEGDEEVVANIKGVDQVKALKSYIAMFQQRDVGYQIVKDRTVDKPIFSFYLVENTLEEAKKDLEYMNSVIEVTNAEGKKSSF